MIQEELDRTECTIRFRFHEVCCVSMTIHSAEALPRAGMLGSENFYVSGRLTTHNPAWKEVGPLKVPGNYRQQGITAVKKSTVRTDTTAPTWEEKMVLKGPAFPPQSHLHLVVFAEAHGLTGGDYAVGHIAFPVADETGQTRLRRDSVTGNALP